MLVKWARKYGYRTKSIWTMLSGFDQPLQTIAIFTGRAKPGNKLLRIRGTSMQFTVRGVWDTWCVKETVLDRCYEEFGFAFQPNWTILDVGGFIGDFSIMAATADERNRVYAFEPFPGSFALLKENLQRNRVTNVEALNLAVSGDGRALAIDRSSGDPLMYECVEVIPGVTADEDITESVSLASFLSERGIDQVDLMKFDCEGAEYDILFNLPPEVLDRIKRIVMEYHNHTTEYTYVDLERFLGAAGYRVESFASPVHPELIGYLRAERI